MLHPLWCYSQDQLYRVLLLLADLPKAPGVRAAASRLLQQLPTCSWVPLGLLEALYSDQPAAQLGRQLLGSSGGVERPGLLLYTLQVSWKPNPSMLYLSRLRHRCIRNDD